MFENPGGKIKKISELVFWINVIVFFILAFTLGFDRTYRSSSMNALFPVFFIGGPLVSYVECLLFYGFGELIESSAESKKNLDDIAKSVKHGQTPEERRRSEEQRSREEAQHREALEEAHRLFALQQTRDEEQQKRREELRKKAEETAEPEDVDPAKKFICRSCKQRFTGWYSTCPGCGAANTMERVKR